MSLRSTFQKENAMQISKTFLVGLTLAGGAAIASAARVQQSTTRPEQRSGQSSSADVSDARRISQAFVSVAQRLAPSVVRITARTKGASIASDDERSAPGADPFEGTPFERYFPGFERRSPSAQEPKVGMGSGVVIDDQGHILTNNHVVADADEMDVTFADGKELPAKLVGRDPKTDVAVIKVDGAKVQPAKWGDSDKLQVGEWVIAIGNPFGLDHSVTVGVLSAKGRYGFAPGQLEDFLQTDASINPGNSGGPLVNLDGEVVGINSMIAGLGTGVGFAVSEAMARPIVQQLIETGKVTRPYIGILMQSLTPQLREAIGPKAPEKGALVSQVMDKSPAKEAGVQEGDVVLKVDGQSTADSREVQRAVLGKKVGDKVKLDVWRQGKEQEIAVRTETQHESETAVAGGARTDKEGKLGLSLQTLSPDVASRLGIDEDTKGAVITAVQPGSPADVAGLREGDVIVGIDRNAIANAGDVADKLHEKRDGGHLVRIERSGGGAFFVAIPSLPENGKG
jgi:Do/DeqQ family serine protease